MPNAHPAVINYDEKNNFSTVAISQQIPPHLWNYWGWVLSGVETGVQGPGEIASWTVSFIKGSVPPAIWVDGCGYGKNRRFYYNLEEDPNDPRFLKGTQFELCVPGNTNDLNP